MRKLRWMKGGIWGGGGGIESTTDLILSEINPFVCIRNNHNLSF